MAIPPIHIQEIPPSEYLIAWGDEVPTRVTPSDSLVTLWNNSRSAEIPPPETLVTRWNNVRAANSCSPSWHILLFRIGTRLEYRVIGRDNELKNKGEVPYSDIDSREPILDDNLKVDFAFRMFLWENRGQFISVLRTETQLFFQIHNPYNDTRRHLPLTCHFVSRNCSTRLRKLIPLFERDLSLAPKLRYFIGVESSFQHELRDSRYKIWKDKKYFEAQYKITISTNKEIVIDLELFGNFSLYVPSFLGGFSFEDYKRSKHILEDSGPGPFFSHRIDFFSQGEDKIVIEYFHHHSTRSLPRSYRSVSMVCLSSTSIRLTLAPNSTMHTLSPPQNYTGIAKLAINKHHLSIELPKNPELDLPTDEFTNVILEPCLYFGSMFNPNIKVTHTEWAVTLLTYRGLCGNHALAAIEGIADEDFVKKYSDDPRGKKLSVNQDFKAFVEFTSGEVRIKFTKDISYEERGPIHLVESERAKALIENVRKAPCPAFSRLGRHSIFNFSENAHNCFTFLQEMGQQSGIDFGVPSLSSLVSMAKSLTHPPEYYLKHPDQF